METNQLIYIVNSLPGFYMTQDFSGRYFRTEFALRCILLKAHDKNHFKM